MIFSNDDMIKEQAAYFIMETDIIKYGAFGDTYSFLLEFLPEDVLQDYLTLCAEIGETSESIGGIIKPIQNEKAKAMLRVILYDAIYKNIF